MGSEEDRRGDGVQPNPQAAAKASHDSANPENLLKFMVTGWAAPPDSLPEPIWGAERFAARRDAVSALFPGETLAVPTGREKIRANDTTYRFRPGTDFYYLTGNVESGGVLVLTPSEGGHVATLYVEPNPGKSDATFFTDRFNGELWVGPRLGVPQTAARYGLEARALADLPGLCERLAAGAVPWRVLRGVDPAFDARFPAQPDRDGALAAALSELRLIKDELELAELREAIAATKRGFEDVIRALPAAATERVVEGVFNLRARVEGNDVGYNTIAASGPNACILHWTRNDRTLREGDLLLLDAGVEAQSLYTADITRTLPVSGTFTPEQREIYQLVLDAQNAALAQCRPGNDFLDPNRAAMRVLAAGLADLGILRTTAEEALLDQNQFYKRYSLHNVSHMLGLDVHDCAAARQEAYRYGTLQAGMVLTVEPGLYFQIDDLTVPARYRGIGVRIEDDVAITQTGCEILSAAIPRATDVVEGWIASLRGKADAGGWNVPEPERAERNRVAAD
jgi:Xaa-Pro aminopeptidase